LLMEINRLYAVVKMNMDVVVLAILALSIIIFGGIDIYLAEHGQQGANKIGDALWWAVVTIATLAFELLHTSGYNKRITTNKEAHTWRICIFVKQ
jgi:hypothetical protein